VKGNIRIQKETMLIKLTSYHRKEKKEGVG
jgi:hypothetical protein